MRDRPPPLCGPGLGSRGEQSGELGERIPAGVGASGMNIAFCYENVLPHRGGCETYIAGLARRLVADGHEVHLYACRWDPTALPAAVRCHRVTIPRHPRFLRPWYFG